MGTPIRLVRNDGGLIELMATTLTMNVDRGVTPLSMPLAGGSRFAFDLNLPKALITIEGIMTDDDLFSTPSKQEATAIIDFTRAKGESPNSTVRWASFVSNLVSGMTTNNIGEADYAIKINNTNEVWLAKHSTNSYGFDSGSSRYYFTVHNGTSALSASQMATNFAALINNYTSTFKMSAQTINSPIDGDTLVSVQLTQVNLGKDGNMNHPSFPTWPQGENVFKPLHTTFSGGVDSTSASGKSAGDKVAELYAVLNNSNNGGGGALLGGGASFSNILNNPLDDREISGLDKKYGDYIIGIQIPFTSKVNDNESLFYMPTGGLMETTDKTADRAPVVGTTFSAYNSEFTGIKGLVANATFVQLGGEPLYSYTINFAPTDWIF